jgi:DNA (cytosine-5)-methyltransferase 1
VLSLSPRTESINCCLAIRPVVTNEIIGLHPSTDSQMIMPKYNLVSLFSGAGGFDFGFEVTGRWQTLIATDIHPVMCETLRRNQGVALPNGGQYLKDASILEGDIQHTDIPGHLGGTQVDLVLGGPPCQSFSVMGKHGGYRDERGSLIYEFADIVQKLRPSFFLFENVPNMKTGKWKIRFREFLDFLRFEGSYTIKDFMICCAHFGAPTIRRRIFVMGQRADVRLEISPPTPTHRAPGSASLFGEPEEYMTVAQAFDGLPTPGNKFSYPDLHFSPQHDEETVERFRRLAYGETDPKRKRDRLDPDAPALTLMSGGEQGGTRAHIHPFEPREITPREAARLHGFPDTYTFAGNKSQIAIQISNSVPIPVARAWGNHLADSLDQIRTNRVRTAS